MGQALLSDIFPEFIRTDDPHVGTDHRGRAPAAVRKREFLFGGCDAPRGDEAPAAEPQEDPVRVIDAGDPGVTSLDFKPTPAERPGRGVDRIELGMDLAELMAVIGLEVKSEISQHHADIIATVRTLRW